MTAGLRKNISRFLKRSLPAYSDEARFITKAKAIGLAVNSRQKRLWS
jgi:hypothetical protein